MQNILAQTESGGWNEAAAYAAMATVAISCAALIGLHFLSREYDPSWRMVSEYANGANKWLLTVVFFAWSLSSFALVAALWPVAGSTLGKIGLALLVLGGVGQLMGGMFDINHKLHGPAAMLGIPSMSAAAVVLTIALSRRSDIIAPPFWSAHGPWIAFALMIASFALFFSALKAAGVIMSPNAEPLAELPEGVTGYVGWTNRLIFLTSYVWAVLTSMAVLRAE